MKTTLASLSLLLLCLGCQGEKPKPVETHWRITLYSGTDPVRHWTSNNEPREEGKPEGFSFYDEDTGRQYRITGSIVIETIEP